MRIFWIIGPSFFISFMLCHATHSAEPQSPLLQANHDEVIIHIQSNANVDPYPNKLLKILSHEPPHLPNVISNIIVQYASRKRDDEGKHKRRLNVRYKLYLRPAFKLRL
jgi:hypothetical protein